MKEIEIKKTSIKSNIIKDAGDTMKKKEYVDYADFIKVCVNHIVKGGFSTDEIRKRSRILEALDAEKDGKIILEDADFVTLKNCIKVMQWGFMHKDIINFVDDIEKC